MIQTLPMFRDGYYTTAENTNKIARSHLLAKPFYQPACLGKKRLYCSDTSTYIPPYFRRFVKSFNLCYTTEIQ